jgi:uncharacterized protein YjbI with pentapeptide repeats
MEQVSLRIADDGSTTAARVIGWWTAGRPPGQSRSQLCLPRLSDDVRVARSARELGSRQRLLSAVGDVRGLSFNALDLVSLRLPAQLWLHRCSFVDADLRQATLDGAYFEMCDFFGADLRGASLRGASFGACDFRGADLRGADLHGSSFGSVNTGDGSGRSDLATARVDQGQLDQAVIETGTRLPNGSAD